MHGITAVWLALCSTGVILSGEPLTFEQAAREAETIISCHVVKAAPRWGNASRTWMETEYTIEIDDTPAPTEKVKKGARLNIVIWGGTIGGETQRIVDLPALEVDKSYLLMLRPGWVNDDEFSPIVGFCQGFFPVVADDRSDRKIVVDYSGRPVYAVAEGARLAYSADSSDVADTRKRVTAAQCIEILRRDMRRIRALPPREVPAVAARGGDEPEMPKKKQAARRQTNASGARVEAVKPQGHTVKGLIEPEAPAKEVTIKSDAKAVSHEDHEHSDVVKGFAKYLSKEKIVPPVTINQLTADMTPWSPVDQECMANWNYYADVILVRTTPAAEADWNDNSFDLHGWLTNADMADRFGRSWGTAIAMCPERVVNGVILEADIAFNDEKNWTLKDEAYLDATTGAREAFRSTLIHELGHMLGLEHVEKHAVMFFRAIQYYDGVMRPAMDDAEGLRVMFRSSSVARNDLGVYLFYHKTGTWSDCTMTENVARGGTLSVSNFTLENVGTKAVAAPKVEFYLCAQRNFNGSFHYLGTITYPALAVFNYFEPTQMNNSFIVPNTVPAGTYYLAAFIRDDESYDSGVFPFRNSMAFSRKKITVN